MRLALSYLEDTVKQGHGQQQQWSDPNMSKQCNKSVRAFANLMNSGGAGAGREEIFFASSKIALSCPQSLLEPELFFKNANTKDAKDIIQQVLQFFASEDQ